MPTILLTAHSQAVTGTHTFDWHSQTCCRFEAAKLQAEALHRLGSEHLQSSADTDRGHITTIFEQDETESPFSDRAQPPSTGSAAPSLDEYASSQELARTQSMSQHQNLPRVRTTRTADLAIQVAISGNRQNSLPDLTSRRAPRPRAVTVMKNAIGPARLDSQVMLQVHLTCTIATYGRKHVVYRYWDDEL